MTPVTRGGQHNTDQGTTRRCIVTRALLPKSDLIRFVVGPDAAVVPDIAGKLPGRGIWVSAEKSALDMAVAKKLFARAARQAVEVPADLVLNIQSLLTNRVIGLISLARKSGTAIAGFEKVKKASEKGTVAVLLQAVDGSGAQRSKIRPPQGENTLVTCLNAAELGLAFGRENVIHAALAAGGLNQAIVEDAARLKKVRG